MEKLGRDGWIEFGPAPGHGASGAALFDSTGHVGGPVVYALDMGRHNEVLRGRFGDRKWYRYEVPRNRPDTVPILVPYDTTR